MSQETGIVESIDEKWVWVKTQRKSACSHCGHKDHCHIVEGSDLMLVKAKNAADAKKGDEVELFISTATKLKCVFMVYMVPVFGLMIGAFSASSLSGLLGLNPKIGTVLFSLAGVVLAYILVRRYSNRMEIKDALTPLVKRVIKGSAGR